ncbi:MAG: glutathione S-transferase C-terminal domain-containing protein, partial [Polaromonas sp.]|nr:glutathione S-transferase C-terminal domain-containing protein [Polaromonas sp.]
IPPLGRDRAEVKTWEALADGLLDASILARLEATWAGRSDEQRSQAWIDRQLDKVQAAVKSMSHGLGDKPFCAGIHLGLADIAVGCALGYLDFRFAQIDWRTDHPNLHKLHDKLMLRPSFADTLPV